MKKVLITLVVIALIAIPYFMGLDYVQIFDDVGIISTPNIPEYEPKPEDTIEAKPKEIFKEGKNILGEVARAVESVDSPYVWVKRDDFLVGTVYGLTRTEFETELSNAEHWASYAKKIKTVKELSELSEFAINNLTKRDGDRGIAMAKIYYDYNGGTEIDALNGAIIQPDGQPLASDETYAKFGLKLDVNNAKAVAFVCVNRGPVENGVYFVLVEADVTCKRNDGEFKDIEWIPEVDETRKVTFILETFSVNGIKNSCIRNFDVYSYES